MPLRTISRVVPVLIFCLATGLGTVGLAQGQVLSTGPGIAGQIHAAVCDPADSNVIYVGGDNCGVYVTRDFGGSWSLWNKGLENPDLTRSYYVDDLLVLGPANNVDSGRYGVYAATHGGIYSRASSAAQWLPETSKSEDCRYWYTGDLVGSKGEPVPFSCLAYDEQNQILYAGSGHGRVKWDEGDRYYPQVAVDKISTCEAGNPQYSLWALDCSSTGIGSDWYPIVATAGFGRVTQIAVSYHDQIAEVVFACRDGLFSLGDARKSLGPIDLWQFSDKNFDTLGWSDRHWGVGAGTGGVIYALALGDSVDVNGVPTYRWPGVYSLDLVDLAADWNRVGDLAQLVPPRNETWQSIVSYFPPGADDPAQLFTLTVRPGKGRLDSTSPDPIDEIFVGERISTVQSGHYRYGQYYALGDTVPSLGWCQPLYLTGIFANGLNYFYFDWRTGIEAPLAPGWYANDTIASTAPLVVSPLSDRRMMAVDYHMPVATEDGGASWHQVYSTSDGDVGVSRGLNIMGATAAAFGTEGMSIFA